VDSVSESPSVREASLQDIQVELLRRTRFNALNGEKVCESLQNHRHLWLAALLDRPGAADYTKPGTLLLSGLIKLRDLPDNLWNADMLYISTSTHRQAQELARIAEGGTAAVIKHFRFGRLLPSKYTTSQHSIT